MDETLLEQLVMSWKLYYDIQMNAVCTCLPLNIQLKGCQCEREKLRTKAWNVLARVLKKIEVDYDREHDDGGK